MTEPSSPESFEFGGFKLHRRLRVLEDPTGNPVRLNAKAFDALLCLVEQGGQVVERSALMEALWPDVAVDENNLAQTISTLRRVLGDETIVTIPKRGYQLAVEVRAFDSRPTSMPAAPAAIADGPAAFGLRLMSFVVIGLVAIVGFVVADIYLLGDDESLNVAANDLDESRMAFPESNAARLPGPFPQPRIDPTTPVSDSPEANAAFQRALAIIREYGGPRDEAYALLNEAIEADNEFMLAYVYRGVIEFMIARTDFNNSHIPGYNNRFEDFVERARLDAERALRLDPNYGYTHALVGGIQLMQNEPDAAQGSFDRAIGFGQHDSDVLTFVASAYIGTGRRAEALEVLAGLDDMELHDDRLAELLNVAGRNELSREIMAKNRALNPNDAYNRTFSGYGAAIEGDYARALAELRLAEDLMDDVTDENRRRMLLRNQIYAYGRIDHAADAMRLYALLDEPSTDDPEANAMLWLEVSLGIGDVARAYEWAEVVASRPRAPFFGGHLHFMYNSYMDPRLDEPNFLALRRQMGYPD
jgi:DNA-binding winged helix-turn-helix (wHTH) protein/tetratricopeptide (TPR) repeat protein